MVIRLIYTAMLIALRKIAVANVKMRITALGLVLVHLQRSHCSSIEDTIMIFSEIYLRSLVLSLRVSYLALPLLSV